MRDATFLIAITLFLTVLGAAAAMGIVKLLQIESDTTFMETWQSIMLVAVLSFVVKLNEERSGGSK